MFLLTNNLKPVRPLVLEMGTQYSLCIKEFYPKPLLVIVKKWKEGKRWMEKLKEGKHVSCLIRKEKKMDRKLGEGFSIQNNPSTYGGIIGRENI